MSHRTPFLSSLFALLLALFLTVGCRSTEAPAAVPLMPIPTSAASSPQPPTAALTPTITPIPRPEIVTRSLPSADLPLVTLNVELFYFERWMRVRQSVELTNTSADAWDEIAFNIPLNAYEETFYLDGVDIALSDVTWEGYPFLDDYQTALRLELPHALQPGDSAVVDLRYRVVIPPVAAADWPPVGTTGWTFDLIQAGEWYPALVPYRDGQGWYTWDYHPVGDPTVYPLVNYRLNVTTEDGVTVASGGLIDQEAGTWHFVVDGGRGIAFLASPYYQISQREVDGVMVRSYYLPEHAAAGEAALEIAIESLALFSDLYGPYPYPDLAVAENGFYGGMEYSAFASVSDSVYLTYQGGPPSILHALVAHEVAHQWWYGAVGNDQVREAWLDESLAFYSELLYFEYYLPDLVEWWWVKRVDQFHPEGPVDVTIYDYEYSADFILLMYGQAARYTRDLRNLIGDEAFYAFLRDYYQTYSGQIVTAADYFETLSRHTDQDLTPLLETYFTPEALDLLTEPGAAPESAVGPRGI